MWRSAMLHRLLASFEGSVLGLGARTSARRFGVARLLMSSVVVPRSTASHPLFWLFGPWGPGPWKHRVFVGLAPWAKALGGCVACTTTSLCLTALIYLALFLKIFSVDVECLLSLGY